jgi:membrane protease subunit HflC
MKIPLIQEVRYFDKRLLEFDGPEQEVTMIDQRRMVVDAYARYRIVEPLRFYQTVNSKAGFDARLQAFLNSSLRNVLGREPFAAVLSPRRAEIMQRVRDEVIEETKNFGVIIEDVRFVRADLHPDNSQAIFRRMQTEREREAREARAQGSETAQRVRAQADRERTVILADAQRQAQILRGQGEAESTKIFADAFNQDAQFYDFWRSLEAQRKALGEGTTMVISPDSDFFRFFRDMQGSAPTAGSPRR